MYARSITRLAVSVGLTVGLLATATTAAPLKVLIVDGQNNHDWKSTTPVMKEILAGCPRFTVDVATTPQGKPMDTFRPDFAAYDVILSNYNGRAWPEATRKAFVDYIRGGGGLVVVHAADNSFSNWPEYNEMIGLGGWGGRNEKHGPYVYWQGGKFVRDTSKGRGGSHGPQRDYPVTTRQTDHPIVKGLPSPWMHVKDELYSRLRGPAKNMTVIATACDKPDPDAPTARHEPALMVISYGKGRVFHTILGHAASQMKCVGFIVTLQRGTEWAATGQVTLTAVPADFPTATAVSVRTGPLGKLSDPYGAITAYRFGQSRKELADLEQRLRGASPARRKAAEAKLIAVLEDPKATRDGRQFVCRVLRRIGSAASVPALAKLLDDEKLSHMARFALQAIPAPEAGAALRAALKKLTGPRRIGVINSVGQRRDRRAVAQLAALASGPDEASARAAISALGTIGGAEAAGALAGADVVGPLQIPRADAQLRCAETLLAEGDAAGATAVFRKLSAPAHAKMIRIAAYRGLAITQKEKAVPVLLELLKDKDPALQGAAGRFLATVPGSAATRAMAEQMPDLSPNARMIVLTALLARRDKAAAPVVLKSAASDDPAVCLAAIEALAVLGDASCVKLVATKAAAGGDVGRAASATLQRIGGKGVSEALIGLAASDEPVAVRERVIEALLARREASAMPALLTAAGDADRTVYRAATKALGILGGEKELPKLVGMLIATKDAPRRSALGGAVGSIVSRVDNVDEAAVVVIGAMQDADVGTRQSLLAVLARLGGPKALATLRAELKSPNENVRKEAIRALSSWADATPMADLRAAATTEAHAGCQILALRGYLKMLAVPANRSARDTTKLLAGAMKLARRAEEKKAVLAELTKFPCEDSLKLAESCAADAALAAEAKQAAGKIKQLLTTGKMKATASADGGNAKNALDGNAGSRWSSGRPMKPGDWFAIDLGRECTVKAVTLDTRGSARDYPRGYEVSVSFDGRSWSKPVLVGKGGGPVTELKFAKPITTRHIRIVQTGSHDQWHWSIHLLKVDLE